MRRVHNVYNYRQDTAIDLIMEIMRCRISGRDGDIFNNRIHDTPKIIEVEYTTQNILKNYSKLRADEQILEFFFLLKKKKPIDQWISNNKDLINKSISIGVGAIKYLGYTPLHFAVKCNDSNAVDKLLQAGAIYTIKNKNGQTPLHLGMKMILMNKRSRSRTSWISNMKLILKNIFYAYSNFYSNDFDNMNLSHFHIACYIGDCKLVEGFLKRYRFSLGINENCIKSSSPYWPECAPIHIACKYLKISILQQLLKFDADITISKDATGFFPIHYLLKNCNENIIDFLYSENIYFKQLLNSIGLLPIHVYCTRNTFFSNYNINLYHELEFKKTINDIVSLNSPIWAGYTPLHIAIHNKCSPKLISHLIHLGADINAVNKNGISALQMAIRKQLINYNIMESVLILYNAKASQPIIDKMYTFFCECMKKSLYFREILLENKSVINAVVPIEYPFDLPGYTPLHFAVESGFIENVELLLINGADPYLQDANQMSPLHLAILKGNIYMTKKINSFCDDATKNPINSLGLSHFHIACICDNVNLVKKFLDYGVMVNLITKNGQGPLHFAVKYGCTNTIKLLLEYNADFTIQDNIDYYTPLHLAIKAKDNNTIDMILSLHSKRIKNPKNRAGLSHFHIACMRNKVNLIEIFLKNGLIDLCSINDPVKFHSDLLPCFTPLHIAVKYRCLDTVRLFLQNGVDIGPEDDLKKLPLHYIFDPNQIDCKSILNLFLEVLRSSNSEFIGTTGLSILHIACMSNNKLAIKEILEQHPNSLYWSTRSTCPRWPHYSPLHFLAKYGDVESIKLLLTYDGNLVYNKDKYGFTPLHVACSNSKIENAVTLLEAGSDPVKSTVNFLTPLCLGAKNPRIFQSILDKLFINNLAYPIYYHVEFIKNHLKPLRKIFKAKQYLNKLSSPIARWFALCFAIFYEDFEVAEKLINSSIKVAQGSLETAVITENMKMVKLILGFGTDPTLGLLVAIEKKSKLVTLLLDAGANANANNIHSTIVSNAQEGGSEDFWVQMIIHLMEYGLDLDHQNDEGKSLLHLSYYPQNLNLLRALLRCGADVNVGDRSGRTVVSYHLEIRTSRMDLNALRKIIFEHLNVRLSIPGFELSRTNMELYQTIVEDETLAQMYETNKNEQECLVAVYTISELNKMKQIIFGGNVSLYQMFREPETVMVWCLNNPELRDFLRTNRLEENFPLCSCLIRMQYGKALKRKRLLEPATSVLYRLAFGKLEEPRGGEMCIRIIADYLDNQDLCNVAAVFR